MKHHMSSMQLHKCYFTQNIFLPRIGLLNRIKLQLLRFIYQLFFELSLCTVKIGNSNTKFPQVGTIMAIPLGKYVLKVKVITEGGNIKFRTRKYSWNLLEAIPNRAKSLSLDLPVVLAFMKFSLKKICANDVNPRSMSCIFRNHWLYSLQCDVSRYQYQSNMSTKNLKQKLGL
eukprot:snap_masked-scaffold_16-processed-gene-6.53-mRNA-1 protein AED:1.00 eAED:1.00 QI:0/-1/0/0/-1/1/1/0/172